MMKKIFPWLVFVVVAAQVAWLGWNYHARSLEFATAPRCRIAVSTYDPRDLTRGYYQRLQLNRHYALTDAAALFGASIDQRGLREEMMQQCSKEEPYLHYSVALRKDYTPDIHHSKLIYFIFSTDVDTSCRLVKQKHFGPCQEPSAEYNLLLITA